MLFAAGRRDRQVLGQQQRWAAWTRRHLRSGRRCQRSLPTELYHRLSLPCVSSLSFLLSACRDGDEAPYGRPGGWEVGCSRQRWEATHVRSAGKVTQLGICSLGPAEGGNRAPHSENHTLPHLSPRNMHNPHVYRPVKPEPSEALRCGSACLKPFD